jgi:hypothetical protein
MRGRLRRRGVLSKAGHHVAGSDLLCYAMLCSAVLCNRGVLWECQDVRCSDTYVSDLDVWEHEDYFGHGKDTHWAIC